MPYLNSYLFSDPLLSAKFFCFEDYQKLSEEGKIPGQFFLDFLKERTYVLTNHMLQGLENLNTIQFFMFKFFSDLGIPIQINIAENALSADKKKFLDDNYAKYKISLIAGLTTNSLVDWMCGKFPAESIFSMTDRLVKEGWIDLELNQERLKNPESYFYKRNAFNKASSVLSLVDVNYAIYPYNIELSWVKIENKKHLIISLINQNNGLAQLQNILPADQKNALVNYLIQDQSDLNKFFEQLNFLKKRQGFDWLQEAQLDLNLRGVDASENKALSDFLDDENSDLLQKIETSSDLATYPDPYFTDQFLTFIDYQALTDEDTEKKIAEKIRTMYGYAEDRLPTYPDRMGENDEKLADRLRAELSKAELKDNYQVYKDEYARTLIQIRQWLKRNNIKNNRGGSGSAALENFNNRLFDSSHDNYFLRSHEDTPYLYIETKKNLEIIAVLLEEENISLDSRNDLMSSMLADDPFTVCTAGCGMKIATMSNRLMTLYSNPSTEILIGNFINDQFRVIANQVGSDGNTLVKTILSLVWSDGLTVAQMGLHAENFMKKKLATFLEMPFLMPLKDNWVENAEAVLPSMSHKKTKCYTSGFRTSRRLIKRRTNTHKFC